MVAIMLIEEVKPLAQFQAQRRPHNISFRHLPFFAFPGQSFQRKPNIRGQFDPTENTVLQTLLRIQKGPGVLKGASLWASENVHLRSPSSSHSVPRDKGQMGAEERLSRDKGMNFSTNPSYSAGHQISKHSGTNLAISPNIQSNGVQR